MKKQKLAAIETCLRLHLMDATPLYDKDTGEKLPYLITSNGEVYMYPNIRVMPYYDSKTGTMYVNFRNHCVEHPYPLAQLIAEVFVPRPEGATIIAFKNDDPTDINSYRADNIEWVVMGTENTKTVVVDKVEEKRKPYGFIGDDMVRLAKLCWCRKVQQFKSADIARMFDITEVEVDKLISSVSSYMESVFFQKLPIRTPKLVKADENRKLKEIYDFMIYLINCEPIATNRQIANALMPILGMNDFEKVHRRVQETRRHNDNVFSDHKLKK